MSETSDDSGFDVAKLKRLGSALDAAGDFMNNGNDWLALAEICLDQAGVTAKGQAAAMELARRYRRELP